MQYKINEDEDEVILIRQAIEDNDGYCPCALEHTEDTKCMCKLFREEIKVNEWCHCGLYFKTEE